MKKALVLGVLAFFAINTATVQNVNAQDKRTNQKEATTAKKDGKEKTGKATMVKTTKAANDAKTAVERTAAPEPQKPAAKPKMVKPSQEKAASTEKAATSNTANGTVGAEGKTTMPKVNLQDKPKNVEPTNAKNEPKGNITVTNKDKKATSEPKAVINNEKPATPNIGVKPKPKTNDVKKEASGNKNAER